MKCVLNLWAILYHLLVSPAYWFLYIQQDTFPAHKRHYGKQQRWYDRSARLSSNSGLIESLVQRFLSPIPIVPYLFPVGCLICRCYAQCWVVRGGLFVSTFTVFMHVRRSKIRVLTPNRGRDTPRRRTPFIRANYNPSPSCESSHS